MPMAKNLVELRDVYKIYGEGRESEVRALDGVSLTIGKGEFVAVLINHNVKNERIQIGRIDLMQNFSFVEVIESQASVLLKALNKVTLKNGRKVVLEVASENTGNSDSSGKKRDRSEKSARKGSSSRKAKAEAPAQHKMKKDDWMQFFDEDSANAGDGWWEKKKRKK